MHVYSCLYTETILKKKTVETRVFSIVNEGEKIFKENKKEYT